jgi:Immunity protein 35
MDQLEAQVIAAKYLAEIEKNCGLDLGFNPDVVEEHDVGFVFFYNTKAYWETRDFRDALAGNGPLLVRKTDGQVVVLPSNQSVDKSLANLAG